MNYCCFAQKVNKQEKCKKRAKEKRKPLADSVKLQGQCKWNSQKKSVICNFEVIDLMPLTYHNQSQQTLPWNGFHFENTVCGRLICSVSVVDSPFSHYRWMHRESPIIAFVH